MRHRLTAVVMVAVGGYKRGGILGVYHWIRCHAWNRYHLIDIRGEAGYDWGWIDRDEAMFRACFKLLREFVEQEDPRIGLRSQEEHAAMIDLVAMSEAGLEPGTPSRDDLAAEREIREIYDWWTKVRPADHAAADAMAEGIDFAPVLGPAAPDGSVECLGIRGDRTAADAYHRKRQELEEKDEEMMVRLIKVRGRLWT